MMRYFRLPFFYAITDTNHGQIDLLKLVRQLIAAGVRLIQYRDKHLSHQEFRENAKKLRELTASAGVTFLLNDYVDLVNEISADGIHLGQEDFSLRQARQFLGHEKIIGVSTHSLKQALKAEADGANYISIGPVWKTPTKPDYQPVGLELVRKVLSRVSIPVVAIGGINLERLSRVVKTGVRSVALVSASCHATDVQKTVCSIMSVGERLKLASPI